MIVSMVGGFLNTLPDGGMFSSASDAFVGGEGGDSAVGERGAPHWLINDNTTATH